MVDCLGDLLDIAAGTLIKGLKITKSGKIQLSLIGWELEQRRLVRTILTPSDRNRFTYTYYCDSKFLKLIEKNKLHINKNNNFHYGVFRKNGEIFFKNINIWFIQDKIDNGDCLGMSLGENIIALQPSHQDIQHADYFDLYVFHKILIKSTVRWIAFQAKQINKQIILFLTPSLMNVPLEMM